MALQYRNRVKYSIYYFFCDVKSYSDDSPDQESYTTPSCRAVGGEYLAGLQTQEAHDDWRDRAENTFWVMVLLSPVHSLQMK